MIASVDDFILYDDMQYTRSDWRNRNQIKTPQGVQWLTVPVQVKGKYHQTIYETEIDGSDWANTHWKALVQNYSRAPFFSEIALWLEPIYLSEKFTHISQLNKRFIEAICNYLGITTKISNSSNYALLDGKSERLADLCLQAGGSEYISGPSAKDYINEDVFTSKGLTLTWFDYADYKQYPQLWGDFVHGVSILDLLFNCGRNAQQYMKHIK